MPSADYKVEIVDSSGEADMSVTVIGDQVVDLTGATPGDVLTIQGDGTVAPDAPASQVAQTITNGETTTAPSQDAVFDALAARVAYRRLMTGRARFDAGVAQTTGLNEAQSSGPSGATGALNVFYVDPADYPAGATLRVRGVVLTNDTAPTASFTVGMYPVTAPGGAALTVTSPFGTVIVGSTAAVTTPAANSQNHAESTDFAMPVAGFYALGLVISSNMAVNSSASVRASLDVKH